jgi:hypothetical protein
MYLLDRLRTVSLFLLFATCSLNTNAAWVITTNTATELTGSFESDSFAGNFRVRDTAFSGGLPGSIPSQSIGYNLQSDANFEPDRAFFQTTADGNPDNPEVICFVDQACGSLFGSYNNNVIGETVDFAITDLVYVSVPDGSTFTGNFSFTVSEVPLPATAWLFGSAMLGLFGVARRKKA